jgi:branched-chain amino acid transport system ATP-binding protein
MALAVAEHGYIMETGTIALDKAAAALRADDDVREFYLGMHEGEARRSFRDLKHYRRRRQWAA